MCCSCGAELPAADDDDALAPGPPRCPRCGTALQRRRIDDIVIDECTSCLGVFLEHAAIKYVIDDTARERAQALLDALPRAALHPLPRTGEKMYVPCPVCQVVMNRRLYAAGSGIIIDVCRGHGTFFDAGELPRMIELVLAGGVDKPARTPDKAIELAWREPPPPPSALPVARVHSDPSRPRTAASVLVELLASLFD